MIIEYDKKYDQEIKNLLVELQEYIQSIDIEGYNRVTKEYREKNFEMVLDNVSKNKGKILLYEHKGKIVGLIIGIINNEEENTFDFEAPKRGKITDLVVSKNTRNNGIGSILLKTMENYLKSVGCKDILLDVFGYNEKADKPIVSAFMQDWLSQFKEIVQCYSEKQQAISPLKMYGLLYRLQGYLNQQKDLLDTEEEALEEEVKIAQKASLEKRFVQEIFGAIELTLSEIIHKSSAKNAAHEYYSTWIQQLELCFSRIEVNLGPIAALEPFLLQFCKPL